MNVRFLYYLLPKGWLLCGLLLVGCEKESPPQKSTPHNVTTMKVEARDRPVSFLYVAQTESSHLVNIQARVNGFLDKRVYTEGQFVHKNDILFIMDKKPFQAQVAAAHAAVERQKAAFKTAKLNLDRVEPLAKLNALSQKDLDDAIGSYQSALAQVTQAEAQLEMALLNLSYCTIRSPIDGITSSAIQQEGAYLSINASQLTTVSRLDPIWVNFSLSENELEEYRDQIKAQRLIPPQHNAYEVHVIQVNDRPYPHIGKITFTEPDYNPDTGTFLIRATIANPHGILRPNQYVRAQINGAIRPHAILVPQKAVLQSAKGHYVWVVDDAGKAEQRPVIVGDWQGDNWFITSGLTSGEQIVINGMMTLSNGSRVQIQEVVDSV